MAKFLEIKNLVFEIKAIISYGPNRSGDIANIKIFRLRPRQPLPPSPLYSAILAHTQTKGMINIIPTHTVMMLVAPHIPKLTRLLLTHTEPGHRLHRKLEILRHFCLTLLKLK